MEMAYNKDAIHAINKTLRLKHNTCDLIELVE